MNTSTFYKNMDYIKTCFKLTFKLLKEYKINLYSSIFDTTVWFLSQFLIMYILFDNFANTINWTFNDFIILVILVNIVWSFVGVFNWGRVLIYDLKYGNINQYIVRPINVKIQTYFYNVDISGILFFIFSIVYSLFLLLYFKIQLFNIALGLIVLMLISILFTLFYLLIDSLNLYSLGLSRFFDFFDDLTEHFQYYPIQFFGKNKIKQLALVIPITYVSYLLVPIFNNHNMENIYGIIFGLVVFLFIVIVLLKINWHYGLKKYDGFN